MPDRIPSDQNMELARLLAQGLGAAPALPKSLASVERRAEFIHRIDGPLIVSLDLDQIVAGIGSRIREIAEVSMDYMPDVADPLVRVNIGLRLWSGCLSTAKTIALGTRSGPNTPQMRAEIMKFVDGVAATDEIYAAGVEAAPAFKRLRDQEASYEGIPQDSRVRRYL